MHRIGKAMPNDPSPSFLVLSCVVLASALTAGGCDGTTHDGEADVTSTASHALVVTSGCPTRSVIASKKKVNGDVCSGQNGWNVQRLVETKERIYCRYERPDGFPVPINALATALGTEWRVSEDCPVVSTFAAAQPPKVLDASLRVPFQTMLAAQTGKTPAPAELDLPRVAVIDTAARPYNSPLADTFGHGRAVGRIIADFACADPDSVACKAMITNHLALPLVPPTIDVASAANPPKRDDVNGGVFGTRTDLAVALNAALATAPADGRFIVNLSVGWDPQFEKAERFPCPDCTDAIRLIVTRLSCAGALLVAAAGNGADRAGPVYPAAWETLPAPDEEACETLGFARKRSGGERKFAGYQPLVHAVGAVDVQDHPLITTRPGSLPRLVAYGMDVITDDVRVPSHTQILTGTSMSAAVVSGVAALVWGLAPQLAAAEVMDRVYRTGEPLKDRAELCHAPMGLPCPQVRRVSACAALSHLRRSPRANCSTVPAYAGVMAALPVPSALSAAPPPAPPALPAAAPVLAAADAPWILPQPGPHGCDGCRLSKSQWTLAGNMPPTLAGLPVEVQWRPAGGGWNAVGVVNGQPSFALPVWQAPTDSAAVRFSIFVGFFMPLPEEAVAVIW